MVINYFPKFLPEECGTVQWGKGPFEKGWKRVCVARLRSFCIRLHVWSFWEADDCLDGFPVDALMFQLNVPALSGKPAE